MMIVKFYCFLILFSIVWGTVVHYLIDHKYQMEAKRWEYYHDYPWWIIVYQGLLLFSRIGIVCIVVYMTLFYGRF